MAKKIFRDSFPVLENFPEVEAFLCSEELFVKWALNFKQNWALFYPI